MLFKQDYREAHMPKPTKIRPDQRWRGPHPETIAPSEWIVMAVLGEEVELGLAFDGRRVQSVTRAALLGTYWTYLGAGWTDNVGG